MTGLRRLLLAASAAVTLAAAGTAASAHNFYIKGFGGASWPQGESIDFSGNAVRALRSLGGSVNGDFDYDTGYLLGVAVGYAVTPNIAAELEYAYRSADVTVNLTLSDGVDRERFRDEGDVTSNAVMVNGLYRFDPMGAMGAVQPYLGAGIGGVQVDFDGDTTNTVFAYQVMGGVSYAVNPSWNVYGELRWFATDGGEFSNDDGISASAGFESIDLLIGAAYNF
jgi:opacity protein-like surface antigen